MFALSLLAVTALTLVHFAVSRLDFVHKAGYRSCGAGVALSYVFIDILPHLSSKQYVIRDTFDNGLVTYLEHHSYLLALWGFLVYAGFAYDVRSVDVRKPADAPQAKAHATNVLIGGLAVYYFLIGYLVGEQPDHRYEPVVIFAIAMFIHALGVNHAVRAFDPERYDRAFAFVLATATFTGWLLGAVLVVPAIIFALVFSFIVGAIMIVAFVFELPVVTSSRGGYWRFVAGSAVFSSLLLLYEWLSKTSLAD